MSKLTRAQLARIVAKTWQEKGSTTPAGSKGLPEAEFPADDMHDIVANIEEKLFPAAASLGYPAAFVTALLDFASQSPASPALELAGTPEALIHYSGKDTDEDARQAHRMLDELETAFRNDGFSVVRSSWMYESWDLKVSWVTGDEQLALARSPEMLSAICSGVPLDDLFA